MRKSSAVVASATGIGALLAGATAYAAFNTVTSVSTTHQAATVTPLTVVSTDTDYEGDQTALWPGHPADVLITVANANEVPVRIVHINTVQWAPSPSCKDLGYYEIRTNDLATGQIVPARTASGPGQLTLRLAGAVTLSATAPDSCQGTKVTVNWTVAGETA
ncbi:hypothetical protein ACPPVO_24880 [Dactylosporangium sp. McL0621]|uniref:hypothetical protein n=1 Tax=Dactylosporangium sp. McL0621 TaxID=3415678 RepID=UPI003CEA3B47